MMMTKSVKVFKNGASQAVRLPLEFRFEQNEIFATLDSETGNVILSTKPTQSLWDKFFSEKIVLDNEGKEFMNERPMNVPHQLKELF